MVGFWNAQTGQPLRQTTIAGIDQGLGHAAFSPDLDRLAAPDPDNGNTVRLWNAATGESLGPSLTGYTGQMDEVVFSPDGHRLAATGLQGPVQIWHVDSRRPISTLDTGTTRVWVAICRPTARPVPPGREAGTVQLRDADAGQPVGEPLTGHNGPVHSVM